MNQSQAATCSLPAFNSIFKQGVNASIMERPAMDNKAHSDTADDSSRLTSAMVSVRNDQIAAPLFEQATLTGMVLNQIFFQKTPQSEMRLSKLEQSALAEMTKTDCAISDLVALATSEFSLQDSTSFGVHQLDMLAQKNEWSQTILLGNGPIKMPSIAETFIGSRIDASTLTDKVAHNNTALMRAVKTDDPESVKELLKTQNIDVNAVDTNGLTLLMTAIIKTKFIGETKCYEELLKAPDINVNATDKLGRTVLMYAAIIGHAETVRHLLRAANINVNARAENGVTALLSAISYNRIENVQEILKAKDIDINIVNKKGQTALQYAAWCGHLDIVKELLKAQEIDVNAANTKGHSALHIAAASGYLGIVQELLKVENCAIDAVDLSGKTALLHAHHFGHVEVAALLQRHELH